MKNFLEFITAIENYYGLQYSTDGIELRLLKKFIESKDSLSLDDLFTKVIVKHSKKWKSLPDISIMQEVLSESSDDIELKAAHVYTELSRLSNRYKSFATDDPACQTALEAIGGWITFCSRSVDEVPFIRKDFIKAYKTARLQGFVVSRPRIFHGELDDSDLKLITLGDATEIKSLIYEPRKGLLGHIESVAGKLNVNAELSAVQL